MTIRSRTFSLVISTFVATGSIHAQVPADKTATPPAPKIDFSTVDKDANGKLSKEEAKGVGDLTAVFDKLDADHDLSISATEFAQWNRAGKITPTPHDPTTVPGGSAGAQHMPPPT